MKKRSLIIMLALVMAFASAIVPSKCVSAKSNKCWYGKYSEYGRDAKKAIKFRKGNKITLKGKFTFTAKRSDWTMKTHSINKTFKYTKNTRFFLDDTNADRNPFRRVSLKTFKKWALSDLTCSKFKVRNGKIVKAVVISN